MLYLINVGTGANIPVSMVLRRYMVLMLHLSDTGKFRWQTPSLFKITSYSYSSRYLSYHLSSIAFLIICEIKLHNFQKTFLIYANSNSKLLASIPRPISQLDRSGHVCITRLANRRFDYKWSKLLLLPQSRCEFNQHLINHGKCEGSENLSIRPLIDTFACWCNAVDTFLFVV